MIWLLAAAALAASAAQDDAQATLDQLRQVYQDSCAQRAYGSYDDVCEQLGIQLHAAEVAADRAAQQAKRGKPRAASDKSDKPAPPAPDPTPASQPKSPPPAPTPEPLGYTPPPHPMG
jgi:hypothetical protein